MKRYALRRLAAAIPQLLLLSVVSFLLMHMAPGGPLAGIDPRTRPEDRERTARALGLDRPLHQQYLSWLGGAARGDFGTSLVTGEPVGRMIATRLPATLQLMGTSLVLSLLLGIALGTAAAWWRDSVWDRAITVFSLVGLSVPVFWLAVLAIIVFAVQLGWLPAGGRAVDGAASWRHLVLPAAVLAIAQTPAWCRTIRASVLESLGEDWLRAVRARGIPAGRIVLRHALRPALPPLVTLLGLQVPVLFTGAAITETVFAWPGIGRLFYEAADRFDYPRLLALLFVSSALVVAGNLAADLVNARIDPRIRLEGER